MEADIKRDPSIRGMFNDEAFWTPTYEIGADTLTLSHLLTSFLVLAFGIFSSVIVIVLELMFCQSDKTSKPHLQHQPCNIDSSEGDSKSEEESAKETFIGQGTMEPNREISQELKSSAEKEPNIGTEKDNDDISTVLAQIHHDLCKEEYTLGNSHNEPFNVSVTSINSPDNMEMDRIGPYQTVLKKADTNIIKDKTNLDTNLSGEGSRITNSPQWSEIINFLDNEEYTTGHFLDEETTITPVISPGLDIPNNIDSRRASSQGSAVSEEDDTKSILAMMEIHETPDQGISG